MSHGWVLELGRRVAERGWRYVDAPVTGLPAAAAAGELTLLVGADPADLEAARPLLDALGDARVPLRAGRRGHRVQAR